MMIKSYGQWRGFSLWQLSRVYNLRRSSGGLFLFTLQNSLSLPIRRLGKTNYRDGHVRLSASASRGLRIDG